MKPRIQSGVVPYRKTDGGLEFCIIRTASGKWGFPKGKVEDHLTPKKSALVEAWEEGGLKGKVRGKELGSFKYIKPKTGRPQIVSMFLMEVKKENSDYLETNRGKKWLPYSKALKKVKPIQKPMLVKAYLAIRKI